MWFITAVYMCSVLCRIRLPEINRVEKPPPDLLKVLPQWSRRVPRWAYTRLSLKARLRLPPSGSGLLALDQTEQLMSVSDRLKTCFS